MKYIIRLSPVRHPWGVPELKNGKLIYEYEILNSKKQVIEKSEEFGGLTKDEARAEAVKFVTCLQDYNSFEVVESDRTRLARALSEIHFETRSFDIGAARMVPGVVYILLNPAMPGYLKIGKTDRTSEERAAELSIGTGMPTRFHVAYDVQVSDCAAAERLIHLRLDAHRVSKSREFFCIPLKMLFAC
jgi:hypothetical protein